MPNDRHHPPTDGHSERVKTYDYRRSRSPSLPRGRGRDQRSRSPSPRHKHSPSRSKSPTRRRRRGDHSRSKSPSRSLIRDRRRDQRSRSRSPRRKHSQSRSRSPTRRRRRGDRSLSSSSRDEKRRKKKDKDKDKDRRKEEKRKKKEKKDKKKHVASSSSWGKYGTISEADMFTKDQEFYTWLIEERKINPETLSKDQSRKEFAKFIEDYNTATLPHEKFYNLAAYERHMTALKEGEFLPPDDSYDPQADMKALKSAHKRRPAEQESFLSKEQLMELRKVQHERTEVGKMKLLGMEVKQNMGVRMDVEYM